MTNLLEYELAYNFYTSEREYHKEQTALSIKLKEAIVNESSTEVIQEGVIESIKKFISKIIQGIQNAWNKFKDKVLKTKLKYGDKDIEKAIASLEPNFNISNHASYNMNYLSNLKIKDVIPQLVSNTDEITKEEFLTRYYSINIDGTGNDAVYNAIRKKVVTSVENTHKVTKQDLLEMYNYLKSYDDLVKSCNDDIESLNSAARNSDTAIQNAVNKLKASQQVNASAYISDMEYYFNEAEDEKPKVDKESIKNDEKDDTTKIIEKKINIFFQATTSIFSAKLKIYRDIKSHYNEAINTHMARYMKEGIKNKVSGNKEEKSGNTEIPQVNA